MSYTFFIILFLLTESWQLINETSSTKASDQGDMKGSCKEERLEQRYHHFNNLLGRAALLEDEYRDNVFSKSVPQFHLYLKQFTVFVFIEKPVF